MALGVVKAKIGNIEITRGTDNAASIELLLTSDGQWNELKVTDNSGVVTRFNPSMITYVTMGNI